MIIQKKKFFCKLFLLISGILCALGARGFLREEPRGEEREKVRKLLLAHDS